DTAHRYVTLYSSFGEQGGLSSSDAGFEEWGLHGNSGGAHSALALTKTVITLPGETNVGDDNNNHHVDATDHNGIQDPGETFRYANAGEVIHYNLTLANTGNTAQTGVTVTDPSVSNLTRGTDIVGNNDSTL